MAEPRTESDVGRKAGRYVAEGRNLPGGETEVTLGASRIAFEGSAGSDAVLPGPADLMVAALAACILKNVERLSGMLPFAYRSAGAHVGTHSGGAFPTDHACSLRADDRDRRTAAPG